MGETLGIVKTLVSPAEKLIDAVQSAIGKAYEPRYVRKMADAKAYEIETVANAMRNSSDIPIHYDKGDTSLSTEEYDAFVRRTQSRMAFQELAKQNNIESVVSNAYNLLCECPDVSSNPVDSDWLNAFFNSVAHVSNKQMQLIWGKILAREVAGPGFFSLRTLEIVRQLSSVEASVFQKICPLILKCDSDRDSTDFDLFLIDQPGRMLERKYNISFSDILLLDEAGLISSNSQICVGFELLQGDSRMFRGIEKAINIVNCGKEILPVEIHAYVLTKVGKELYEIALQPDIPTDMANQYLEDCLGVIKRYGFQCDSGLINGCIVSLTIVDNKV